MPLKNKNCTDRDKITSFFCLKIPLSSVHSLLYHQDDVQNLLAPLEPFHLIFEFAKKSY